MDDDHSDVLDCGLGRSHVLPHGCGRDPITNVSKIDMDLILLRQTRWKCEYTGMKGGLGRYIFSSRVDDKGP